MDVRYRAQAEVLLYKLTGSWFDPQRATLLPVNNPALSWEPLNPLRRVDFSGIRRRVRGTGRARLRVPVARCARGPVLRATRAPRFGGLGRTGLCDHATVW